jgi:hypothetical protein
MKLDMSNYGVLKLKKILSITCFLFLVTSLGAVEQPLKKIPLSKVFWSLFQEDNILGHNDCTNKCGRYLRALVSEGHQAEILIVMPHKTRFLHAIIKIKSGDTCTYLDPTNGVVSQKFEMFGFFQKAIQHSQLASLGADFK